MEKSSNISLYASVNVLQGGGGRDFLGIRQQKNLISWEFDRSVKKKKKNTGVF